MDVDVDEVWRGDEKFDLIMKMVKRKMKKQQRRIRLRLMPH